MERNPNKSNSWALHTGWSVFTQVKSGVECRVSETPSSLRTFPPQSVPPSSPHPPPFNTQAHVCLSYTLCLSVPSCFWALGHRYMSVTQNLFFPNSFMQVVRIELLIFFITLMHTVKKFTPWSAWLQSESLNFLKDNRLPNPQDQDFQGMVKTSTDVTFCLH